MRLFQLKMFDRANFIIMLTPVQQTMAAISEGIAGDFRQALAEQPELLAVAWSSAGLHQQGLTTSE